MALRQSKPSHPSRKLRLIHTSDTHFGDPAGHPRAEEVLTTVVEAVRRLDGDMLLLAGDVFDNERVSDETVGWFVEQMALVDAPVIVLPGNHDLGPPDICVPEGALPGGAGQPAGYLQSFRRDAGIS